MILLSEMHEHADRVEKHLGTTDTPLWQLVQTGQISKVCASIADMPTADVAIKQTRIRQSLDAWFRLQRRTAVVGLSVLVIAEAYSAYCKIYS
jgi:hypothetical protein